MVKRLLLIGLIGFMLFAGLNHFINPEFYIPLIPDYFPYKNFLNIVSGILEIAMSMGLVFQRTRRLSSYALIILFILFIPSHVYFIQIGSCVDDGLCVPNWLGHLRLWVIHPLLIFWVYSIKNVKTRW